MARHANNRKVSIQLRDHFPFPYTLENARYYLDLVAKREEPGSFAIEYGGEAVGGIAFHRQADVHRRSAEIGYWLGEEHWGIGLMTEVVTSFSDELLATTDLVRLFATPFASNDASNRVLEKAGFVSEGRLRKSVVKEDVIMDQLMYAKCS
jgi:RimJ/RimL family protein N-acetyltransferase